MVVGAELVDRPPALLAEVVGQLVGGDREEVGLHVPLLVVVRQAGQEPDERLLHHVLAGRPVAEAAVDEGEQPPLVALDQLPPGRASPARTCRTRRASASVVAIGSDSPRFEVQARSVVLPLHEF